MTRFLRVRQLLKDRGIRLTTQRELVLRRAMAHLHFSSEELVADIRTVDASVSRASVYRTLALLHEAGVVEKHDFRYGPPHYEVTEGKAHHDHLMCTQCGEIIEFQEPRVERLQFQIVKRYGYQLRSHTHKLYGLCRRCQRLDRKHAPKHPELHVTEIVT